MDRESLALEADELAVPEPQRIVSLRLFDGHVHRLVVLALFEASAVFAAVYAAVFVRFSAPSGLVTFDSTVGLTWPRAALVAGVFLLSLIAVGLYQLHQRARFAGVLVRVLAAVILAQAALALVFYALPDLILGRGVTLLTGGFAFFGLALTRYLFLRVVDEEFFKRRVLIWGAGQRAAAIGQRLRRRSDQRGFRIVGYVRAPGDGGEVPNALPTHPQGELVRLALRNRVQEIVVAMDDRRQGFPTADLLACRLLGMHVTDLLAFLERESGRVSMELVHPSWLIFCSSFRYDIFRLTIKRLFDVAVSLAILLVTLPVSVLAALAIFLEDRGPVFYRQVRVGQNGRHFTLFKFRSMRVDAEPSGEAVWAAPGDPRVTLVGRLIRRLRIDEIPQAFNVLRGQMSFVGPRPERPAFVETLSRAIPFYAQRHFVKPGVTGWAQIRYSYGASEKAAKEKLEYDLYYVKHHSLAFDLMVLLQTVEIVLFRIGSR